MDNPVVRSTGDVMLQCLVRLCRRTQKFWGHCSSSSPNYHHRIQNQLKVSILDCWWGVHHLWQNRQNVTEVRMHRNEKGEGGVAIKVPRHDIPLEPTGGL